MSITGKWMVWWLELFAIPVVATLLSLRERRYWCKQICLVGAVLRAVGYLYPFIKPKVKDDVCVS
jgi:polyferredoxin